MTPHRIEIVAGDCVVNEDGGALMTVSFVFGNYAHCVWYQDHEVHRDNFEISKLTKWMKCQK